MGSKESKKNMELLKPDLRKWLGKDVTNHVIGQAVLQHNMASGDSLANKVEMNVNVFGMFVESGILWKMVMITMTIWACKHTEWTIQ